MEKRLMILQEHLTKRNNLHWDIRFECSGDLDTYLEKQENDTYEPMKTSRKKVLRSFVLPKHEFPTIRGKVKMAIQVEDHAWEYKDFEGTIEFGYGEGEVKLLFSDYVNISTFTDNKITFEFNDNWYIIFNAGKNFLIKKNN